MLKLLIRLVLALLLALLLGSLGVTGNSTVIQTLFTVLGIVFSISMSLLVSFSLSKILNQRIRLKLRESIIYTRNMILLDFGISTFCLVIALMWDEKSLCYNYNIIKFNILLIGIIVIIFSLAYEIYNFRKLNKLHTDIEDAIISENS